MSRRKLTLLWICFVASILFTPLNTHAFRPEILQPAIAPSPQASPGDDRRVVVFDNDYLDRRFGKDRAPESNGIETGNSLPGAKEVFQAARVSIPAATPSIFVAPNRSLLTAINRGTPARRAAALRLAEIGRTLLQNGHKRKAIYYLEKALSVEANPFIHYYLARAHYQVANYRGSMRFLEVAEAGVYGWPEWITELASLRAALSSASLAERPTLNRNVAWTFNE